MEPERPEPAALAVELYREEELHRRRSWLTAGIALGCTLLGAAAVITAIRLNPQWFVAQAPTKPAELVPSLQQPTGAVSLYTEPVDPKPPGEKPEPAIPPAESGQKVAPPSTGQAAPAMPFNPFSGAIISRSDVPEGWEPGKPNPEADPTPDKPSPEPVKSTADSILITARSTSGDPEGEAAAVASALQGAGASVRTAHHYNLAGAVIGVQVVATLPAASADQAIARLNSAGVGGAEKWSGPAATRADRVSDILNSRISELRKKENELREKYEDDATEVAVVREEIQKLNQALAAARSAKSSGVAIILVGIGVL